MQLLKNDNILFITARRGYAKKEIELSGYNMQSPYKDRTMMGRVLRECCFHTHILEKMWYAKVKKAEYIIVQDPLVTSNYLKWLAKMEPDAKLIFMYCNLIGNAKHIFPQEIPQCYTVWTYDPADAEKYQLNFHVGGYCIKYIGKSAPKEYDIFYVGADKGRGPELLRLQNKFEKLGLKTKFIITSNGRFARKKSYYSRRIPYEKVIEYDNRSKAILNIVFPRQKGVTMRDFESLYNGVKLITNNKYIKNYDFYSKENIFILDQDDWRNLREFLNTPFKPIDKTILEKYTYKEFVKRIIAN